MAKKAGTPNRLTRMLDEAVQDVLQKRGMLSPLEFLLEVYSDKKRDIETRVFAAKSALPYVHKRMPVDLNINNHIEHIPLPVPTTAQLAAEDIEYQKVIEGESHEVREDNSEPVH